MRLKNAQSPKNFNFPRPRLFKRLTTPLLLATFLVSCPTSALADSQSQTLSLAATSSSNLQYTVARLDGTDRIATSITTAQKGWDQAETVFLDEYDDYSDAIAATPLAVKLDAPILLSDGNTLDPRVKAELTRLHTQKVILLGGTGRLGKGVEERLTALNISWEHLGGQDRYETSALIAAHVPSDSLIIVNGDNFPDALSAASYAGIRQIPILLTSDSVIPKAVSDYYHIQKASHVIVIGGEGVVPSSTLSRSGIPLTNRLGGFDRYDTAAITYRFAKSAYSSPDVYLASGENFPDALVGSVLAAKEKAPLLISQNRDIAPSILPILSNLSGQNSTAYLFGGKGVLRNRIQARLSGADLIHYPLSGYTIVVDAGHGSPDPGAIGPTGTQENDNTLAIAQDLGEDLKQSGATVIQTRTGNASPANTLIDSGDLKARVSIANANFADLFVSIHNDSATGGQGTTTYYSEDNPQNAQSLRLAQALQAAIIRAIGTLDHGVKEALFYVIHHTTMPAALVEVAYISNRSEEKLLADPLFRQKAADGIYQGILNFYT